MRRMSADRGSVLARSRSLRPSPPVMTLVLAVLGLGLIEVAARTDVAGGLAFIPVADMLAGTWSLLVDPTFWTDAVAPSVSAIALSFLLATAFGIAAGLLLWRWRLVRAALDPYLVAYYAVPIFALYPMFVVIFGLSIIPVVLLGFLFGVVVIIVQTMAGLDSLKPVYLKLADVYGLTPVQRIRYVLLPAALPSIVAGMKLGLTYCIVSIIATEFLISTQGLGHEIALAYNGFDLQGMYGAIIVILVGTVLVNALIDAGTKRVEGYRW